MSNLTERVELHHGDLSSIAYRAELDRFLPVIGRARITPAELALAGLLRRGYEVVVRTVEGKRLPGRRRLELAREVKDLTGRFVERLIESERVHHLRLSARCLGAPVVLEYGPDWTVRVGGRYEVNPARLHKNRALVKLLEFVSGREVEFPDTVVDLGAAPGGWSSFAAQVAERVLAVDPARLEERVRELDNVHHLRVTAQEFALPDMLSAACPGGEACVLSDVYSGDPEGDLYGVLRVLRNVNLRVRWALVKVAPVDEAEGVVEWFREEAGDLGFEAEEVELESASANETFLYLTRG